MRWEYLLFAAICWSLWASPDVQAATVLFDDFESYASPIEFADQWKMDGNPPHRWVPNFGRSSTHSVLLEAQRSGNGVTNRWYRDLATPLLPTDARPVLFSFDFYLEPFGTDSNWAADWQLADVRAFSGGRFGAGSLQGIVAMGVARSISAFNADHYNREFFQGRVLAPGHTGQTYYSLDALPTATPRSSGWHHLAARIGATEILFLVDGQPAESVTVGLTTPISTVILGSDVPSVHRFWIDNVHLQLVPEPNSLLLALFGTTCPRRCPRRRPRRTMQSWQHAHRR
jgi:hypothetical protein